MKRFLVIFGILFITFSINSEKWVGQVATYNLQEGVKIADGSIFNADNESAACNGFKLGTSVTITNVKTGQQLAVKVNDRVKNDSDYFMLLTPKAAKDLGLSWETSLVVVEANFSDINSTEILNISGLVAEGAVDPEKFKKFPDINWPENGKEISTLAVEKEEKTIIPDQEKITPEEKAKNTENVDKLSEPALDKKQSPDKIMKQYAIDKDAEANFLPKLEYLKEPSVKERSLGEDRDETILPKNETLKTPETKEKSINEDMDELLLPKKEFTEEPVNKGYALGEDLSEKLMPKNENIETPEKIENEIDRDTGLNESENADVSTEETKNPETETGEIDNGTESAENDGEITEEKGSTGTNKIPSEEISKKPLTEEKEMDLDSDKFAEVKEKEKVKDKIKGKEIGKSKDKAAENNGIVATGKIETGNTKTDTEEKNFPKYSWLESLPKGKIYIRFSATYEKEEGERRISIFKQVFKNVTGLKENNKYILMIGPLEKKDIDKTLKGIRSFGYSDAYIIQK
jgi:rare lipoprotein A (peptidoglycan hydrolase)